MNVACYSPEFWDPESNRVDFLEWTPKCPLSQRLRPGELEARFQQDQEFQQETPND